MMKNIQHLAECGSDGWHPLVTDFILLARKLEEFGFRLNRGKVLVVNPEELQ
jgi:hypothetical protein